MRRSFPAVPWRAARAGMAKRSWKITLSRKENLLTDASHPLWLWACRAYLVGTSSPARIPATAPLHPRRYAPIRPATAVARQLMLHPGPVFRPGMGFGSLYGSGCARWCGGECSAGEWWGWRWVVGGRDGL